MLVFAAVRAEQGDTVAVPAVAIGVAPFALPVKANHGRQPAGAVQIRPLIGEAQMRVDDAPADGLEIEHAGVGGQMLPDPRAQITLERRACRRLDGPVIEGAARGGRAEAVAQPHHRSGPHGEVGADVLAFEQRHPEVSRRQVALVVLAIGQHPAADAHAAQVHDGLAEYREGRRAHPVRRTGEALRLGDRQLVVDPAMRGVPQVRVRVLGGNAHVLRARHALEVLQAPGIGFAERHGGR